MSARSPAFPPAQSGRDSARRPKPIVFEIRPFHRNVPNQELLADLRAVALRLGARTLTRGAYKANGRFTPSMLYSRFGSWNAALRAAGLRPLRGFDASREQVIDDIRHVARKFKTPQLTY